MLCRLRGVRFLHSCRRRIYCADLHLSKHLATLKARSSGLFPPQGEWCRYHVKEQPCTARGAFLMSWLEQMKWIPTSKPSPFFWEGKVAVALQTFNNESIHSTHTLTCSLRFSYPALETALGISEKSQFLISFWQAVFYFQQQEDLCTNNLLSNYWYQAVLRRLCWIESYRASGSK